MPKTHVVSYSELSTFRQCPLKHELSYKERWSRPPKEGSALARGSLFHSVLEAHYLAVQDPTRSAEQRDAIIEMLAIGDPEQSETQGLVEWIWRGYIDVYGTDPEWEIVAVEYANEFWLPTPKGGRSPYKLKLKIDLIVRERRTGHIWIVDHKTCKNLPDRKMLEFDDQFGLYTWGLRQLGKTVFGSIHNACRTQRLKTRDMTADERFRRTLLYRTDAELDTIAIEAYKTARRAYAQTAVGTAERCTDTEMCSWKCDFTEPCLGARKGGDLVHMLTMGGYEVQKERH